MPVSPADFEFYSRVTGQPVPNTPAGRMAIAPQVYAMRRSPMSKVAGFLGELGKTAALAGGAVAGGMLLNDLYQQRKVGNQTSEVKEANTEVKSAPVVTQATELADSQHYEPTGVDTTPDVPEEALISQQGSRVGSGVPRSIQQGLSQYAMQRTEMLEGSQPGGPTPFQEGFAELGRQAKDVSRLKKQNPGASLEFLREKINESQAAQSAGVGDENVGSTQVGAQTLLFPQSESVKGVSIFPSAVGEGGIGRADITYKKVSKEEQDLPVGDQGRYSYMLTKEGQERMQGIAAGQEEVPEKGSEFLRDFTARKQLISMDPKSKRPYGIKPSLSDIL